MEDAEVAAAELLDRVEGHEGALHGVVGERRVDDAVRLLGDLDRTGGRSDPGDAGPLDERHGCKPVGSADATGEREDVLAVDQLTDCGNGTGRVVADN